MKTMTVGEFKAQFSEVLKEVAKGKKIAITYGKKREIKALIIPNNTDSPKRKFGVLKDKASFRIKKNFKMTEEEFLGL